MIADALSILMDPQRWGGDSGFIMRSEQHIVLTLVVLIIGSVLAIPLGIWCAHVRPGEVIASILMNSARALPSLGLLILFGLWLGVGVLAPTLALIVLVFPSLFIGAYSGIMAIDAGIIESARATGHSWWQQVRKIEIPLALPLIVGGFRQAALLASSTAPFVASTSVFGLGRYIFAGLKTRDYPLMLCGSLLVILITFFFDLIFGRLQAWTHNRPWKDHS